MLSNPVSILNQLAQKERVMFPVYNLVSEMGESHNKMFRMNCVFMSFKTEAIDKTKKEAKRKAAEEMVHLLQSKDHLPCPAEVQLFLPIVQAPEVPIRQLDANLITNPVGWLQEYCMKKNWKIPKYQETGVINSMFHCTCTVHHLVVSGSGFKKQLAKTDAALKMCHLINGTKPTTDLLAQVNKLEETVHNTPPSSPLKTLNTDTDSLDSDSVDSPFHETSPEQNGDQQYKYSISFLHQLVTQSKAPRPDFEYMNLEETAGLVFKCLCKVITLEAHGCGRSKIEAKAKAADKMVNLIFVNSNIEDANNFCEEYQQKAVEYLQNLQKKEYGGDEIKIDEIAKRWLELRKQFPSAKVKPKKVNECRERHCFFKNLDGECIRKLRNSSVEVLVEQGMNFLKSLEKEQNFKFRKNEITSDGEEKLCIITLDAEVPLAFHGSGSSLVGAEQKSFKNCILTLQMLLE